MWSFIIDLLYGSHPIESFSDQYQISMNARLIIIFHEKQEKKKMHPSVALTGQLNINIVFGNINTPVTCKFLVTILKMSVTLNIINLSFIN